ncbi:MAG: hypothetical protein Q7T80_15010 [Methanoregula sp.]|nr:hypothetical protein [Methanoregula sp.]
MACDITAQCIEEQNNYSNQVAAKNRNLYPVQEQATQMDLWEYVPCNCDDNCTCRKHGCTHHWKLKKGVKFEEFRDGFLRMFVDRNHHQPLIDALNGKGPEGLNTRAIGAFHVLRKLRDSWPDISERASDHNKTIFCDDWLPVSFRDRMSFPVEGTSIYLAKQYCVLFPDIGVPYDTASRIKMCEHLDLQGVDYVEFLTIVREAFLKCMEEHALTIPALRRLDDPQGQLPFDPQLITLPRPGMDYGTTYAPAERTISIVLDKCFYQPKTVAGPSSHNWNKPTNRGPASAIPYTTQPLSGKGQTIMVHLDPPFRLVLWGDLKFELSNDMIRTILEKFFIEPGRWYLLGASMTEPDPDGLGSFVRKTFPSFSPRHASAIAAILVDEGFVIFRGRKPIELKKSAGREEMERLTLEEEDA